MSGYRPQKKTFGLTYTKMQYWHAKNPHKNLARSECTICNYVDMRRVADSLEKNGFKILKIGDAFVEIDAPSPRFVKFGMETTKEIDKLYKLISGLET